MNSDVFTGPGSIYKVFEEYKKAQVNESGEHPVFIKPIEKEKKVKSIN